MQTLCYNVVPESTFIQSLGLAKRMLFCHESNYAVIGYTYVCVGRKLLVSTLNNLISQGRDEDRRYTLNLSVTIFSIYIYAYMYMHTKPRLEFSISQLC